MAKRNSDYIGEKSIDWAIKHISKYGDTDIFPVPFEYHVIEKRKQSIIGHLKEVDFSTYKPRNTLNCLVPKMKGYRVSRQLDPIDNILLLAAIKEISVDLENSRADENVACAYRVDTDSDNSLKLYKDEGYKNFNNLSEKLTNDEKYKYVLTLDIADFYNQIYLHGVHNQLESAGISFERASNIEDFLININSKKSIGLPVGPVASIILSEIVLNDLDFFILDLDVGYVRYVDDMRLFCKSKNEAEKCLREISEFIWVNLRLTLQTHKVNILIKKEFRSKCLFDPEDQQQESYLQALKDKVDEVGYGITEEEVEELHGTELEASSLKEVFSHCLENTPFEFGYFKAILRLATKARFRSIVDLVLGNLNTLMPVYRDVINYLLRIENDTNKDQIQEAIEELLKNTSKFKDLDFQIIWSNHYFYSPKQGYAHSEMLESFKKRNNIRDYMLLLRELDPKYKSKFLSYKEKWQNFSAAERRAIIYASKVLPSTERKIWLRTVQSSGDFLEREIAHYLLGI